MIKGAPIELALAIIESIRPPDVKVTTRFIAEICMEIDPSITVRHQDIYFLEQRALKKLRAALKRRESPSRMVDRIPTRYRLAREAALKKEAR